MFYSKSTGGFYTIEDHGSNIPQDCVEITLEYHTELFKGQEMGKVITANDLGYPELTDNIPDKASIIKSEILMLESLITPRRLRECLISGDLKFINDIDNKILELRKQLQLLL